MKKVIKLEENQEKIFTFRGKKVMVDRDLADLYGVQTKRLNEQVKRNVSRFAGYIFQLNNDEKDELVANCDRFKALMHSSSNPYVFDEHGTLMLASILNSDLAIEINRKIISVFIDLRREISEYSEYSILAKKLRYFEKRIDTMDLSREIDIKLLTDKMMKLSSEVRKMSLVLDEFQDNHLIIKRPDGNDGQS